MFRYELVMKEIKSDRNLRKQFEEAVTDAERMEIVCETAFQMGWDEANYENQMNTYWRGEG